MWKFPLLGGFLAPGPPQGLPGPFWTPPGGPPEGLQTRLFGRDTKPVLKRSPCPARTPPFCWTWKGDSRLVLGVLGPPRGWDPPRPGDPPLLSDFCVDPPGGGGKANLPGRTCSFEAEIPAGIVSVLLLKSSRNLAEISWKIV